MSTYETMIVIGMGLWIVVAVAIFVALLYAIVLLRRARTPLERATDALAELQARLRPVVENIEVASEHAQRIASRLGTDADEMGRALRHASDSTTRMVELVEDRVAEVAALLEVVQEEAEETFLSTASLLRGLRRGGRKASAAKRVTRAIGLGRD